MDVAIMFWYGQGYDILMYMQMSIFYGVILCKCVDLYTWERCYSSTLLARLST